MAGKGAYINFFLDKIYQWYIIMPMEGRELQVWRKKGGLSQVKLAEALGVSGMTVARWEWGARRIPPFLHLALKALENRLREGV